MADNFKDELKEDQKKVAYILEKIKTREWSIYIKKKKKIPIHDKFYFLKSKNKIRVIIGSPNLTETGLYNKRQKNIITVADYDLPAKQDNENTFKCFLDYFEDLKANCDFFMQDLISLLDREGNTSNKRDRIIKRWLNESSDEFKEKELKKFIKDVNEQALDDYITEKHTNFSIDLPDNQDAQNKLKKIFPNHLFERTADDKIIIPGSRYFNLIKDSIQYPLMYIKQLNDERFMYLITDKLRSCTFAPETAGEVNMALQNLEDFCNTVELGQTINPFRAKMIFFEAILYFLNSPFSHELMKAKKETVGIADDTGLQYLFICGLGANSKTQLVRFMLKVLTGQLIDPLPVEQFTNRKVQYISKLGTVFPIVADDVRNEKLVAREDLFKNYWEKHWHPENDCPQLILTTNYRNILNKEWVTRRIKGLDFDVIFKKKQENSQKLNQIMGQPNPIFHFFSYYYLNKTDIKRFFKVEDELNVARHIIQNLYKFAGRPLPEYFPERPVEEIYDKNWEKWNKSVKLKKVDIKYKNGFVYVHFPADMKFEIKSHLKSLPQELMAEIHGNKITTDRSLEFRQWLNKKNEKRGFLNKLFS